MSRLAYFVRETLISLRRNLLMTIAGIITVAISLFLFGGILLVSATVDHGTEQWKHGIELEIFMKVGASAQDVQAIHSELAKDPNVKSYQYLTQADAYALFKKDFSDQPALVESTKPSDLPESFRVAPKRAEDTELLARSYTDQPDVDTVIRCGLNPTSSTSSRTAFLSWFRMMFTLFACECFATLCRASCTTR